MTNEEFLTYLLVDCNYPAAKILPDGEHYAAVMPQFYTHAVIAGQVGDISGYDNRWCYDTLAEAVLAWNAWDGTGEPVGWHRHPPSGRRIARADGEYDEHGNLVPIGQEYVRR